MTNLAIATDDNNVMPHCLPPYNMETTGDEAVSVLLPHDEEECAGLLDSFVIEDVIGEDTNCRKQSLDSVASPTDVWEEMNSMEPFDNTADGFMNYHDGVVIHHPDIPPPSPSITTTPTQKLRNSPVCKFINYFGGREDDDDWMASPITSRVLLHDQGIDGTNPALSTRMFEDEEEDKQMEFFRLASRTLASMEEGEEAFSRESNKRRARHNSCLLHGDSPVKLNSNNVHRKRARAASNDGSSKVVQNRKKAFPSKILLDPSLVCSHQTPLLKPTNNDNDMESSSTDNEDKDKELLDQDLPAVTKRFLKCMEQTEASMQDLKEKLDFSSMHDLEQQEDEDDDGEEEKKSEDPPPKKKPRTDNFFKSMTESAESRRQLQLVFQQGVPPIKEEKHDSSSSKTKSDPTPATALVSENEEQEGIPFETSSSGSSSPSLVSEDECVPSVTSSTTSSPPKDDEPKVACVSPDTTASSSSTVTQEGNAKKEDESVPSDTATTDAEAICINDEEAENELGGRRMSNPLF